MSERQCSIDGCNKKSRSRGWCGTHYTRWYRHGDPLITLMNMVPVTWDFLLSNSIVNEKTGCIEWQKCTVRGYGIVVSHRKKELTHRMSYRLNVGDIPNGLNVLHHCDNPPCINTEHLFLGTQADNGADMKNKGRSTYGARNPNAKLTDEDIICIRKMDGLNREIAKTFDVSQHTISRIKARTIWRHI